MTPQQVLDSPAGLLDKMATLENVYQSFQEFNSLRPGTVAAWVNANKQKWAMVTKINGWD